MKLEYRLKSEKSIAVIFAIIHARQSELGEKFFMRSDSVGRYEHATVDELDDLHLIETFNRMITQPYELSTYEQMMANHAARAELEQARSAVGLGSGPLHSSSASMGSTLALWLIGTIDREEDLAA